MYLAIRQAAGLDLPSGQIVGMHSTLAGLRAAGFAAQQYSAAAQTLVSISDDLDDGELDPDCEPGWYWIADDQETVRHRDTGLAGSVARDIIRFRDAFAAAEAAQLPALLARDHVDTAIDSGHSWVDDILHGWAKPWLRATESLLAAAKAAPSIATVSAYTPVLRAFLRQAEAPGLTGFHRSADRSVWRPMRDGLVAWEYDPATGRPAAGTNRSVQYPAGETVATWSAYRAIEAL